MSNQMKSQSSIGKQWVHIPETLKGVTRQGNRILVEGLLGQAQIGFPNHWKLEKEKHRIRIHAPQEEAKLHGTLRMQLKNLLQGLAGTGYRQQIQLVGVGYRVQLDNNKLHLKLGFSHPVVVEVPQNIRVHCPKNNILDLQSWDAQALGQFIGQIRRLRPPDPYKGKGVVIRGQQIRRKQGKK